MVGAPGLEPGPDDPFPCVASHCSDGNPSPFVDVGPGLLALLIIAAPKWLRRCQRQIIARNPHLDRRPRRRGKGKRYQVMDAQVPGLGVRVTHKRTKTYGKVFIVTR